MHVRVAAPAPERRASPRRDPELVPVLLFALFLVATGAFLLTRAGGTTFYFDEWSVWTSRHGADPDKWLGPINGHLSAVPILIFTTITKVFGAEDLLPYRVAGVGAHLTLLVLIFVAARPRARVVGRADRDRAGRRRRRPAGWCSRCRSRRCSRSARWSVASARACCCAADARRRRRRGAAADRRAGVRRHGPRRRRGAPSWRWRRPPACAGGRGWRWSPLVLYLVWRAWNDVPSELAFWDLALVPSYVARRGRIGRRARTSGCPRAGGRRSRWRSRLRWRGRRLRLTRRAPVLLAIAAVAAGYWALIAFARGPALGPEEVRYVYANTFLVLLVALAVLPRDPAPAPVLVAGRGLAGAAAGRPDGRVPGEGGRATGRRRS